MGIKKFVRTAAVIIVATFAVFTGTASVNTERADAWWDNPSCSSLPRYFDAWVWKDGDAHHLRFTFRYYGDWKFSLAAGRYRYAYYYNSYGGWRTKTCD
jgi:hypothetical protein